jgi:hypothetical protein
MSESGLSRRALLDIRAGRSRPHAKNQERLKAIVRAATGAELGDHERIFRVLMPMEVDTK